MFHVHALLDGLHGLRFGHPLYLYQRLGSTNDLALTLAEAGAPEGLLVVAEEQTAGRGRAGRAWITPPGAALAFSLVLRPALPAAQAMRLSMLAGLAACEAIEHTSPVSAALKWPNDVLVSGKKVAGILIETALEGDRLKHAVLGLGVNVGLAPAQVDFPATCLRDEAGCEVDRVALLRAILGRLETHAGALQSETLFRAWRARLALLDGPLSALVDGVEYVGRSEGVDPDGTLHLRLDSGEVLRLRAGDVRLRPAG